MTNKKMHIKSSAKKNRGGYSHNKLAEFFTKEQISKLNGKKKSTKEKPKN
jgi:hypothetical protein